MTIMWICILLGTLLISFAGLFYLFTRIKKFYVMKRISGGKAIRANVISALVLGCVIAVLWFAFQMVNVCVILIYLTMIWILCELLFRILRKWKPGLSDQKCYFAGITAILVTALYLSYGWYVDRHVVITEYTIESEKVAEPLKIVQFSDSHMGTTFDGKGFAKHVDTIKSLEPDLVVMTGDYIDGSTKYEDILSATEAYGTLSPKYGSYFIFGNHDKNHYGEDLKREYTEEDLTRELTEHGIVVLEDEVVSLGNGYSLIGRKDRSEPERKTIAELMEQTNTEDFVIDLNHQPNDYAAEEAAGVDLVLSGHTHGGQFRIIRNVGIWIGANDKIYGYEKRGGTNFIVSSGIADWALDFKTGCVSEIVVINVVPS